MPSRAVQSLLGQMDQLERSGLIDIRTLINDFRREVILILTEHGDEIQPADLSGLKQRFDAAAERYKPQLMETLSENQRRLFVKGIQTVDQALETANVRVALPYLSEQTLQVAQEFGADLITGLTDYSREQITKQVRLAVMGQKPVSDVIREVGRNLKDPSVFGTVKARAEAIFKTEVNRIANLAATERLEQAGNTISDLRKQWLHSHVGTPRVGHLELDGTIVDVKEKFTLRGVDGKIYLVDGPHDPTLPVGDVVNCKCRAIPVVGRFDQPRPPATARPPASPVAPPTPAPAAPTFSYGESAKIPSRFEQRIGEQIFPDEFWDQMQRPASFVVRSNSNASYYMPSENKIQIGSRRGLETPEDKKFFRKMATSHEYGHNFHYDAGLVTRDHLDQEIDSMFQDSIKEYQELNEEQRRFFRASGIQSNLDSLISEFGPGTQHNLSRVQIQEYLGATADVVQALTAGADGFGHRFMYWNSPNVRHMEYFAHSSETFFMDNPVMDKLLPKTRKSMREWWLRRLQRRP